LIVELAWLRHHRRESWRRAAAMRAERPIAATTRSGGTNR